MLSDRPSYRETFLLISWSISRFLIVMALRIRNKSLLFHYVSNLSANLHDVVPNGRMTTADSSSVSLSLTCGRKLILVN